MGNKKPFLITLAAMGGIVLLTVAVALLRGCGGSFQSAADAPYPNRWTEKSNGSIVLTLNGKGTGAWTAESTNDMVASVLAVVNTEGGVDVYLEAGVMGEAEVSVSGASAKLRHVFTLSAEHGELSFVSARSEAYAPPEASTEQAPQPVRTEDATPEQSPQQEWDELRSMLDSLGNNETAPAQPEETEAQP